MLKGGRPPYGEDKFADRRTRRTNVPKGGHPPYGRTVGMSE